jgi:hypothetical protein
MSERVSLGAAGQRLGVGGGDIRWAGYTKVTAGRLGASEYRPPAWLCKARARNRRRTMGRAGVSCWVRGTVQEVRPSLVEDYTHLVCGPCNRSGERPEVPSRPGMIVVRRQCGRILRRVRPPDRHIPGARQRSPGCCPGSRRLRGHPAKPES